MVQARFFRKIAELRHEYLRTPELPFAEVLRQEQLLKLLGEMKLPFRDRIYSPWVTLWMFLSQVLHPDPSCRATVARLLAFRTAQGQKPCSADTSSYCQARQRLPETLIHRLVQDTGAEVQLQAPAAWHVHGRPVKVVDGSTVSMPDSQENTDAFGKPGNQRGLSGFPVARIVVLLCLATGTVLEAAVGPYRGPGAGELTLFRSLHASLQTGDLLLGDRLFCSYFDLAALQRQGVDAVVRLHASRRADFRRGKRLGSDDHVVLWKKPKGSSPWLSAQARAEMPQELALREVRVQVKIPGYRDRTLVVVTTLTDPAQWSREDIAELYQQRWQAELNLRSIKDVMHMDELRCQSPDLVRKEIWMHLLAYNLLRSVMCAAAEEHDLRAREVSFKGAKQLVEAFYHLLVCTPAEHLEDLCTTLLKAAAQNRVGQRPGRYEPRKRKRAPKPYPPLKLSRDSERKLCARNH